MVLEGGMQPLPFRDVEDVDRNILREVELERKKMLVFVSMGEWNSVLKILSQDCPTTSIFRLLPMNSSKDTFMHLAASEGQTEVVRKLLELTKENNMGARAPLANVTGNTPLHLAAAHGHEETCRSIIEEVPEMAAARNVDGETPIFVAALSGSKKAFSTLSSMLTDAEDIALVRRNDGDTILHCAVSGEYFDFASEIIERFSQLVYYRNERGLTPLHILANNPSAFRSGCRLLLLNRLLYASIKVSAESKSEEPRQKQEDYPSKLAGNYLICWTFFKLWKSTFAALGQCLWSRGANISAESFLRFFRFLLTILHVILALSGFSRRMTNMRNKKQKHLWANKVMHQLLQHIEHWWDFGKINTGMDPYGFRLEGSRGGNAGSALPVGGIPIALQLEKEIATASETNSIQESQIFPTTRSLLSDPSSSSIPRTDSNMFSPAIGAGSNLSKEELEGGFIESPFLIAGREGVKEMVEAILNIFPMAIHDIDLEHKNIILLAAEHRQYEILGIFLKWKTQNWAGYVDVEGNSVLHLAAKHTHRQSLLIPGAALQMPRDITWFKFVKEKMPPYFTKRRNNKGQTAMEVFNETHEELAKKWAKWLNNAAQSCSVVAALIISVVFVSITTVPGGLVQDKGPPVYRGKLAFDVYSVSSLIALISSSISLIMFLGILTSPYEDSDFGNELTRKLIYGLASLFISIEAMFLSFFTGDQFVLDSKIKFIAYPIFVLTSCVALVGFPFYSEVIRQIITDLPIRNYPNILAF